MITTRAELSFYIAADRMMNRGTFHYAIKQKIKDFIKPDYIMRFLVHMRKCAYFRNTGGGILHKALYIYHLLKYQKLGIRLGFSIGYNVFGYGLVIPHYGTIVVGETNHCGNYAVLHTSTCISDNGKVIGDGLYLSTGAKITSNLKLGNNISIGANSMVNKSITKDNVLIAGQPASIIKDSEPWYIRDGRTYEERVRQVEELHNQLKQY